MTRYLKLPLGIALVLAVHGCQTRGQRGDAGSDGGALDATGPGSGGAAGQAVGGASGNGGRGGDATGGTSGTGGGTIAGPDVSGRWAMFAFEDPVAAELNETNGVIGGNGCCAGLKLPPATCCAAVTGQVVGRRVTFGFAVTDLGPATYATEAFVSADGQRMAGTFRIGPDSLRVAWVRIGPTDAWLPSANPALTAVMRPRAAGYALSVSDDSVAGNDFSAQQTYHLDVLERFVTGDLGAYWDGEMSWNAADQTLVVGPVPETAPGLPVALSLRFDGSTLASVEAMMASGARYRFRATASQP